MAFVSQEMKKELAPGIKAVLKKYGVKGSIAVRNHMSLVVTLREGVIDFTRGKNARGDTLGLTARDGEFYDQVNTFHISSFYEGETKDFLNELVDAMKGTTWYDRSDIMTDYFDTAYYIDVNVGAWDKGYIYTGEEAIAA